MAWAGRALRAALALLLLWLVLAYLALPLAWRWGESALDRRIAAAGTLVSTTTAGIPGDPINLLLLGSREEVARAMAAAGWHPADPVTLRSAVGIGLSVALGRPDPDAPVSPLLFRGRPQDLAFERALDSSGGGPRGDSGGASGGVSGGGSAERRHHVRFWADGPGAWWGAASLDRGVGLSRDTGEVTHRVGPDLDAERDLVAASLREAGWAAAVAWRPGALREGRNGGGDPFRTDGRLAVVTLAPPGGG